jgi:hypothetical protein
MLLKCLLFPGLFAVVSHSVPTPPNFSDAYSAKGTLYIPYAEIREPFYAWYDLKLGSSRIDYYGGKICSQTVNKNLIGHTIYSVIFS